MRVFCITSGIFTFFQNKFIFTYLLGQITVYKPIALGCLHISNNPLLCFEIIPHRLRFKLLITFFKHMAPVSLPVLAAGLTTCAILEHFSWFGYGAKLPNPVRKILADFDREERKRRNREAERRRKKAARAARERA